jgi:hypothetical protein
MHPYSSLFTTFPVFYPLLPYHKGGCEVEKGEKKGGDEQECGDEVVW